MVAILRISFLLLLSTIAMSSVGYGQGVIESIAESHIKGNVPDEKDFRNFLIRDLQAYFKESLKKDVRVDYELLRKGPTQTGIAFPKFYAWIKIYEGGSLIDEGVVRLAAIEKKRFTITNYLGKSEIKRNPQSVEGVFPKPLVEIIKEKAGS